MMGEDGAENFWDLLAELAHLERRFAADLDAWAAANTATARAFESNAETLRLMAELGRRAERLMRTGPSAAVRQALEFFADPLPQMDAQPGTPSHPLSRFWEAWRAAGAGPPDRPVTGP